MHLLVCITLIQFLPQLFKLPITSVLLLFENVMRLLVYVTSKQFLASGPLYSPPRASSWTTYLKCFCFWECDVFIGLCNINTASLLEITPLLPITQDFKLDGLSCFWDCDAFIGLWHINTVSPLETSPPHPPGLQTGRPITSIFCICECDIYWSM